MHELGNPSLSFWQSDILIQLRRILIFCYCFRARENFKAGGHVIPQNQIWAVTLVKLAVTISHQKQQKMSKS